MPIRKDLRIAHIKDTLILGHVSGLGPLLQQRLQTHFETPGAILDAPRDQLQRVTGVTTEIAKRISKAHIEFKDRVDQEFSETKTLGFRFCLFEDDDYPPLLREIPDPPRILTIRGQLSAPVFPAIGIVGSRRASRYGLSQARAFARELTTAGVTIISGLARGIDAAAHQGALDAGGPTLAILGCGANLIYPPEHESLANRIETCGALLTEFNLGAPPRPHHFPRRNRLIAGLVQAVLVIEAAQRSGSLITARLACEYGRDIHVLPGPVDRAGSWGTGRLLRDGAVPVLSPEHVLEEIKPLLPYSTTVV